MEHRSFDNESKFEEALILRLFDFRWEEEVLKYKTEKELIKNWADIIFENNRGIDNLGSYPLTETEMQQIINQINAKRTPFLLNSFILGKETSIIRDNPDDTAHLGKEVTIKLYDPFEIAGGKSRYQIAQQPKFEHHHPLASDRRGDFMLLINGMPLIHVELKATGVPISQATNQIEKYSKAGIFSQGLFSLVQVFVAMNPEECVYFANPGQDGIFDEAYFFHWQDFHNNIIDEWEQIAQRLLYIPMAHQLIGFYTVADDKDGILKVMRSYQIYAVQEITDVVKKTKWDEVNPLGGYVWHTTGSGKTLTSFKAASLIAKTNDADKVVFLMDRIELGNQSLLEYQGFAEEDEEVHETKNTGVLINKLKSSKKTEKLIVSSIQKLALVNETDNPQKADDIAKIKKKRLVFIFDEAHRDTFGDMMVTIKATFPNALYFGFTGTPIKEENERKGNTTSDVFGGELHQYAIACGIRDKNVLGFDPTQIHIYKEKDLRRAVALEQARAESVQEAMSDERKKVIYLDFMNEKKMAGYKENDGSYIKGIEDYIPTSQYETDEYRRRVVESICDEWTERSLNFKYHAIFATSSIPEAIAYFDLFLEMAPELKVTTLYDPSIDNNGNGNYKETATIEMLEHYRTLYGLEFSMPKYPLYKKDVAARLAHKKPYQQIGNDKSKQIDLLIVVDQMLTGFDSKWVNTLYLDKLLVFENVIQAFSRTNRLAGTDKQFGNIVYFRKPFTMQRNIDVAFKTYAGTANLKVFEDKLEQKIALINSKFTEIRILFETGGVENFAHLPESREARARFAKLFREFNRLYEGSKVQGFEWDKYDYRIYENGEMVERHFDVFCDKRTFLTLVQRYKELFSGEGGGGGGTEEVPFDIDTHIIEIPTDRIDADYLNSRFHVFVNMVRDNKNQDDIDAIILELHKSFASLSQEEQRQAELIIHDIHSGKLEVEEGRDFRSYINEYIEQARNTRTHRFAQNLGIDEALLIEYMSHHRTRANRDEFGAFSRLKESINITTAQAYIEKQEGHPIPLPFVIMKAEKLLEKFLFD